VPIASSPEQVAAQDSLHGWARSSASLATVRAMETNADSWRGGWKALAELGVFAVALPEDRGGFGGSVLDLAVMLEQAAHDLVPGPVLSTALAGLLIERSGAPSAKELLPLLADGSLAAGVALASGTLASPSLDELVVTGEVRVVIGAAPGSLLVLSARTGETTTWFALDADTPGLVLEPHKGADLATPFATARLDAVAVPDDRVLGGLDDDFVRSLVATLAAAEAAGVSAKALAVAVDYAKIREQFGRPIGSFQAIKHLLAEMLCKVELTVAVAWDAARAIDEPEQFPLAAAVAATIALDSAVEVTKDCIQVLGGIGFTFEHDAHFYLRRALSLRSLLGGTSGWRRDVATRALGGARRHLGIELDGMDTYRAEVEAEAGRIAALPEAERRAALADSGYLAPHWPAPYGRGASPAEQLVIDEELHKAGITRPDLVIAGWAVPTILRYGTPEQIEKFALPTLRGELVWCQLFSEPGAGSDLASLRMKAEKVDGGWRLTGQKVWTSLAHKADWAICLARTDTEAPKHKGITYFLVDMKSAGIDARPLREITGDALFNEVFLDDVFVPDEMVVGEVNGGWKLARATLANERVAMGGGSSLGENVEKLLALAVERGAADDPSVQESLGWLIAQGQAVSLLSLRGTLRQLGGLEPGSESSVGKLVGVKQRQAVQEVALDLLGPDGALDSRELWEFLMGRCLSIAGGTTQVLLTLAGERILGLPRDDAH
jgi:alkylation response protein AidB-like acyl-CoA dehydrogenase